MMKTPETMLTFAEGEMRGTFSASKFASSRGLMVQFKASFVFLMGLIHGDFTEKKLLICPSVTHSTVSLD